MRKISITPDIEMMVEKDYAQAIMASSFHQTILQELQVLKSELKAATSIKVKNGSNWVKSPSTSKQYADYVDYILSNYQSGKLLTWQPMTFCPVVATMDGLVSHQIVGKKMKVNGIEKDSFATRLVKAMHYDDIREKIVPSIYRKLELKACVYCNANYTIADKHGNGYFDLDHWKPKSFYPFLCISFFNLQPSCSSCNRRKSYCDDAFFGLWDDTLCGDLDVCYAFIWTSGHW